MALATPQLSAPQQGSLKRFSAVRDSQAASPSGTNVSAILRVKSHRRWSRDTTGAEITAATVAVVTNTDIQLTAGALERTVVITGKPVREIIREINALDTATGLRPWRAGYADVHPNHQLASAVNFGATSSLLGQNEPGLAVSDSINQLFLSVGGDFARDGAGDRVPEYIDTGYIYNKDPANNPNQVGRGGGIAADQGEDILPLRRSAFGTGRDDLDRELNPASPRFDTVVQRITHNLAVGAEAIVFRILEYDFQQNASTVVWSTQNANTVQEIAVPNVRTRGPAYIVAQGAALGAITAGVMTVEGVRRTA